MFPWPIDNYRNTLTRALTILAAAALTAIVTWRALPPRTTPPPRRCGTRDQVRAAEGPCRWNSRRLTYRDFVKFDGVADEEAAAIRQRAYADLAAVCGLELVPAGPGEHANLVAKTGILPKELNSALALASIACDNVDGDSEWQRYSRIATWDARRVYLASIHEIGHNLGLTHNNDPTSMMQSKLNEAIDGPGPVDVANLQLRYGPPQSPARGR